MTREIWKPHVVVAAVIERDGQFLLVEEHTDSGILFNQPAGHLEEGESLLDAVRREVFEETAHHFEPEALLGVYRWRHPKKRQRTYLRFAFTGRVTGFDPSATLDDGILRALWMSAEEIAALAHRHRSPLILDCLRDYQSGRRFPLDFITDYPDEP
ncbi:MAG: NUDIX hydrolase [Gammaproteobacteria bacterium]|nr:NUDIX hydrolase [Gammaproteobacteria bacterium]